MTTWTIKTNENEANKILENTVTFIFRSDKDYFKVGDTIQFRVIKNNREVLHKINSRTYTVTTVLDYMKAPIERGYTLIGFRRTR